MQTRDHSNRKCIDGWMWRSGVGEKIRSRLRIHWQGNVEERKGNFLRCSRSLIILAHLWRQDGLE